MPADPCRVAIDVTPMLGVRTGIGVAVAATLDALAALDDGPELVPYALSRRARAARAELPAATLFPPWPARILLRTWARTEHPRIDRHLGAVDVLHATNYLAPPSAHPSLVTVWDCTAVRFPDLVTPAVRAVVPVLRRAVARGAWIHTGTAAVAAEIDEHFGPGLLDAQRIVVVPPGAPPLAPPGPPPRALGPAPGTFVLAVGALEPRKHLPLLVRAFGVLGATRPDLRLVVAGPDGPDRPAFDAAVDALPAGARDRVLHLGRVDDPTKRALLDAATVLAYPSRYEGFGFPVLEAMAAGTPVVASATGAVAEVAGDAATLVPVGEVDALAEAIGRVVDDPDHRADLASRGRARTERFRWPDAARGLAEVYRRIAATTPGPVR